jgi:hypothetical protein
MMNALIALGGFVWFALGAQAWRDVMRDVPPRERDTFDRIMLIICMMGGPIIYAMSKIDSDA